MAKRKVHYENWNGGTSRILIARLRLSAEWMSLIH